MKAIKLGAACAGIVGALWLADSAVAMHAEKNISEHVRTVANLEATPRVYLGGMPYSLALISHTIPYVEVNSMDVEVPHWGMVNASTTLRDVTVPASAVLDGNLDGALASTYTRTITLDAVGLGRLINMDDVSISNPTDVSPSGGTAAEATLSGTLPGDDEPTTVTVELRLVGPMFHMRPVEAESVPLSDDIVKAFSLDFDTRTLPLPQQASKVSLRGGSISFEVQKRNHTLASSELSPLEIEGHFDAQGREVEPTASS